MRLSGAAILLLFLVGCSTTGEPAAFEAYEQVGQLLDLGDLLGGGVTNARTLEEFQIEAARRNPGLRAAYEKWRAELETVAQARSLPDPRLSYGGFIQEVETRVGRQRHRISLAQTFPWFGKLRLRGDAALDSAEAAYARFEGQWLRLEASVAQAYGELYYLERAVGLTRENLQLLQSWEEVVQVRYRAAAAGHPDLIRIQTEMGKLEERIASLEALRQPRNARLNSLLGRPAGARLPRIEQMPREEQIPARDRLEAALEANPDLRALRHDIDRAKKRIDLARLDYFPDITVGGTYIETSEALNPAAPDSGKDPLIAGLSLNLPIWRDKLRAGVQEAEARQRVAERTHEDTANRLATDLAFALFGIEDAERKVSLYRDTLIPKEQESLLALLTAYQAEEAAYIDLIQSQRALLEFQLVLERSLTNRLIHFSKLQALVGSPVVAREAQE